MKFKYTIWFVCLVFTSTLFFSCSKSSSLSKNIPEDATMVFTFNVENLLTKSGTDIGKVSVYKDLIREIKQDNRGFANQLDDFITKPKEVGIDWREEIFIYPYDDYVVLLGAVSDKEKFKKTFEGLIEELEEELDYDLDKEGEYEYLQIMQDSRYSDYPIIGWTESKFMVIVPTNHSMKASEKDEELIETLEELMTLESDESLTQNENFMSFMDNTEDASYWMSYEFLEEIGTLDDIENEIDIDLSDTYYSFFLKFEEGEAIASLMFHANDEIKAELKESSLFKGGVSKSLVTQLPNTPIFATSLALTPDGVKDYLRNMGVWKDINKNFEKEYDVDLGDLLKGVEGDFVFALSSLENKTIKYRRYDYYEGDYVTRSEKTIVPNFVLLANLRDDSKIKKLLRKTTDDKNGDIYEIETSYYPYFATINGETLIITNEKDIIKGKYQKISKGNVVSTSTNNAFQANLNLDFKLLDKAKLKLYEDFDFGETDIRFIEVLMDKFSNAQISLNEDSNKAQFVLKGTNSAENTLKTIIDILQDISDNKKNRNYSPSWTEAEEVAAMEEPMEETMFYHTLVGKLNVRSSPSLSASVVTQLKEGASVEYLDQGSSDYVYVTLRGEEHYGNFLKIRTSSGYTGWVHSATIKKY